MDSLLHSLGLGYFLLMGAAALWGMEDLLLPRRQRRSGSAAARRGLGQRANQLSELADRSLS